MSTHTPGPWRYEAPDEVSIRDSEGGRIAVLTNLRGTLGMSGRRDPNEVIANARLIAAAPELLEACKTFAQWLDREETGYFKAGDKPARDTAEGEAAWREWYDENLRLCSLAQEQAHAAIRKATEAA